MCTSLMVYSKQKESGKYLTDFKTFLFHKIREKAPYLYNLLDKNLKQYNIINKRTNEVSVWLIYLIK